MRKRALLIGSQTGGLRGVHADVALMADTLGAFGFEVTRATAERATRRGIIDAYRTLIDATRPGDAAVVYYSGHGGMARRPRTAPESPARIQYLCPTDIDESGERTGFRGLLADELSLLQYELSARTANVTTIIDSCHSARMARYGREVPKARAWADEAEWATVHAAWRAAVREAPSPADRTGESNPSVVRLVACGPGAIAFEMPGLEGGRTHGLFTATLARLLRQPGAGHLTWRGLMERVRPAVMDAMPLQRPEAEGPADRRLFEETEQVVTGVLPVLVERNVAWLRAAGPFGIGVGDQYALVPPGGDPAAPRTTAVVDQLHAGAARLRVADGSAAALPPGVEAHPLQVGLGRRPVAIVPQDHRDRARVSDALAAGAQLRIARHDEPALATVALEPHGLRLRDAGGEPLRAATVPLSGASLAALTQDLRRLARAAHLRALESGSGAEELPDDVGFSYALLHADGSTTPLAASGEHLFNGDQVVVRIHNHGRDHRYVSMFDIGLRGAVEPLTTTEPSGVEIEPGGHYELFRLPGSHRLAGVELFWPDDLPRGAPRPESFIAVVTDRPQDLTRLAQRGTARRTPGGSPLQRLADDIVTGVRDARRPDHMEPAVRYRVARCDFHLHPGRRPGPEPAFAVDERPDPTFLLVPPLAAGPVPRRLAVRLREAVAYGDGVSRPAALRVDCLAVTRAEGAVPYRATTHRIAASSPGTPLPPDGLPLYSGPVRGAVDLALWVSHENGESPDLERLLADAAERADEADRTYVTDRTYRNDRLYGADKALGVEIHEAMALLATPAAAPAGAGAGAVDAVAALVRAAAVLLDRATGASTGAYRTTLLPHERYAVGDGAARHPADGLLRAGELSFAYEVVDTGRAGGGADGEQRRQP
ncbi:caspase family protein [Streptomyces lasiicapitis]|uniref:caspase family protein n=1 Tax=Streptomyces lasiicapitis TaxID=1923961 RepID=UPI00366265F5